MRKTKKKTYFVYFLKQDDEIVYVGCTGNLKQRMARHKNKVHNNVSIVKFKDKMQAHILEGRTVITFKPKYNWIAPYIKKGLVSITKEQYYSEFLEGF